MNKKSIISIIFLIIIGFNLQGQRVKNFVVKKFINQTSLGYANGLGYIKFGEDRNIKNTFSTFRVQQQLGYQFNSYVSLGLGAGVDIWRKNAFIPLFVNINVYMLDKKVAPVLYLNGGYAFKWYVSSIPEPVNRVIHATIACPYGELGLGVKIELFDRLTLLVSADYLCFYSQINYSKIIPGENNNSAIVTNSSQRVLYNFIGAKVSFVY